ncbi:MAG: hypothetical protein GEV03_11660 [Streptosporangiales bacterium]|nr:hypothetical protein [Streptosporangiales bacterium]
MWADPARRPSPIFLGFVVAFVAGGWLAWATSGTLARVGVFVFVAAGWIVSLCLHEFGHAYLAWRAGDRGVEARGYLTLNPLRYSHAGLSFVLPLLFLLLGGIGLPGGAVYVNPSMFRSRLRASLVSAAGPLANVVFAVVLAGLVRSLAGQQHLVFWGGVAFLAFLQVTAAVLNLLPVPGLDGYGIAEPHLPPHWSRQANQIAPFGLLIIIALLWVPQLNQVFFGLVFAITDALGVPVFLVGTGDTLFRFWLGLFG